MTSSSPKQRCLDRWYPLIDHPTQQALIDDPNPPVRFKVVPAGRRSGKTERAKRYITRAAFSTPGNYFVAAPTRDQVKRIYWEDLKLLSFSSLFPRKPSETELIIFFPNSSTIQLIGMDEPSRIEGPSWKGGVVDEIASIRPTSWEEHIAPALDTVDPRDPDYRAWCWLIGVPEGLGHYYRLANQAQDPSFEDWKLYHWNSADILPEDVIETARQRMTARQFRQEYEASFETVSGRIYEEYHATHNTHYTPLEVHEQLLWAHDFNYSPLSSAIFVRRSASPSLLAPHDHLFAVDEIVLDSAVARQAAMEFIERYKHHGNRTVVIYGDPSGRAGEKHGHGSDYTEMEALLRTYGWSPVRRVKARAPGIKDRHNAVRARILNANDERRFFVNPTRCPTLHEGMLTVQLKEGSTFQEEHADFQHITTAVGYLIDYEWPIIHEVDTNVVPLPTKHYYR